MCLYTIIFNFFAFFCKDLFGFVKKCENNYIKIRIYISI